MSIEKGCIWNFWDEGPQDIGRNNALQIAFRGNQYYSIVRESIQNSMDVWDKNGCPNQPVKVEFSKFRLNKKGFPGFFAIKDHLESIKAHFTDKDTKELIDGMLKIVNKEYIDCLKISDYNTLGMQYTKDDQNSDFYKFLRSQGVTRGSESGSGGSYGFGKGAYFAMSLLNTVLVSTMDCHGNNYFEGSCHLMTHRMDDRRLGAVGYYDNKNGYPICDRREIPSTLIRNEQGTDISIIGLSKDENYIEKMVKSVLNSFWLAIYNKKLEVSVEEILITKDTLDFLMEQYFPEDLTDRSNDQNSELANPKSYYYSVRYFDPKRKDPEFKMFDEQLKNLGRCQLFVYRKDGLSNKTMHVRSPNMLIYKKLNQNILKGYSAVFVCENEWGNNILRQMENPQHNEWNQNNAPIIIETGSVQPRFKSAFKEYNDWIKNCIRSLLTDFGASSSISGVDDYLKGIETDESPINGGGGIIDSPNQGSKGSDASPDESGMLDSKLGDPPKSIMGLSRPQVRETGSEPEEPSPPKITLKSVSYPSKTKKPKSEPPKPGISAPNGDPRLVPLGFPYKVIAPNSDGKHLLIIESEKAVDNCQIQFFAHTDSDELDNLMDLKVNTNHQSATIDENWILGISLCVGKNLISLDFSENSRFSLHLNIYEVR